MTDTEIDLDFLCDCLREAGALALTQRGLPRPFGSAIREGAQMASAGR